MGIKIFKGNYSHHGQKYFQLKAFNLTIMDHSIYIYGMKFPNRIFVGGLPKNTDAKELATFFERFGVVTEAKIILDRNTRSTVERVPHWDTLGAVIRR